MDAQDLDHERYFETMSKRRKGFPSETKVKRVVRGDKELVEKVGRNDLCPCGSGKLFKKCCRNSGRFRWREPGPLLLKSETRLAFTSDGNLSAVTHKLYTHLIPSRDQQIIRGVFGLFG